jgi:cephalosporin-C deacetylase-like acetyl esterase
MFNIDDNCTAFDVAIAMYIWLSEWHDGQWSDRYSAMCKMGSDYNLQVRGGLDESSQFYYDEITEDNWSELFDEWVEYMDNKFDLEAC